MPSQLWQRYVNVSILDQFLHFCGGFSPWIEPGSWGGGGGGGGADLIDQMSS